MTDLKKLEREALEITYANLDSIDWNRPDRMHEAKNRLRADILAYGRAVREADLEIVRATWEAGGTLNDAATAIEALEKADALPDK